MNASTLTANQTIERLHNALGTYIEAAYHISDPRLIRQRARLLEQDEVIHRKPFLESTPRYKTGQPFDELGLPAPALAAIKAVTEKSREGDRLLYDPPFVHQAEAVQEALNNRRSLVITTGTGSGKTESFLMPLLGTLARQAEAGAPFEQPAVRAILLYPMNALVNDQLGRLRLLLGDPRIKSLFQEWAGRPARFARYTSRTLYPGVRDKDKDQRRLKPLKDFYVETLGSALDPTADDHESAKTLYEELKKRGKWPAKEDLIAWWGSGRWEHSEGFPRRCITMPGDAELLTRHEVLDAPPDVLVTNYSMLEYMMMRPIERPLFDKTAAWLAAHTDERLLLVIDEAHLYRGAGGAEVALLLRRLQTRLGVGPERFQVILTSASFNEETKAQQFAADLSGLDRESFVVVGKDLNLREKAEPSTPEDAERLAALDLSAFYEATTEEESRAALQPLFDWRGTPARDRVESTLYDALKEYSPLGLLINRSMEEALPLDRLGKDLFPDADPEVAERAVTVLMALGSAAREEPGTPGLLPCRIHAFFRGLPGLWACLDPQCSALDEADRGGPTGKLYAQPRDTCDCGARVFELYTCRDCGTAYARAYTDRPPEPYYPRPLNQEPGGAFALNGQRIEALTPLDLLLEEPTQVENVECASLDLESGMLNVQGATRTRPVFLWSKRVRSKEEEQKAVLSAGQFARCGVCDGSKNRGPIVQDHQTKGDQPFQALVTEQVQVQPPTKPASSFAPLQGRKVLIFADSRQLAARMAPVVQTLSTRDTLRPLIVRGYSLLNKYPTVREDASLDDLYIAVLIAAAQLKVRLRPELAGGESFHDTEVAEAVKAGILDDEPKLLRFLLKRRSLRPPQSLARDLLDALAHRYYGLRALGLASARGLDELEVTITNLPDIAGIAETEEQKRATVRLWLQHWLNGYLKLGFLNAAADGNEVRTHKGVFQPLERWLGSTEAKRTFKKEWLPKLLSTFAEARPGGGYWLRGDKLSLDLHRTWGYCERCKTVQRPFPDRLQCIQCGAEEVRLIEDPDADPVFNARKGYYRASTTVAVREPPEAPVALLAAEHTAQLNNAQQGNVFSEAEVHELLFQDVDLGPDPDTQRPRHALDVLSCTTTMEVGIDIGSLSGVALRNLPPARSNYQQRAGRAGRRGNAVATVTAFGSADSHDEHYFSKPEEMISGEVKDPALTLQNRDITRRHLTAYLLQRFFHEEFPDITASERPHLFSALGTVGEFCKPEDGLTRQGFADWLGRSARTLRTDVDRWLPDALSRDDRATLLDGIEVETLEIIDRALDCGSDYETSPEEASAPEQRAAQAAQDGTETAPEDAPEEEELQALESNDAEQGNARDATKNLLDRLLYEGVLPRYAFPTDVAAFYVFAEGSSPYRPTFRYTPQQGLAAALSQYAPGKQLYIGNKRWTSGAIYSLSGYERRQAWDNHEFYLHCSACGYAKAVDQGEGGIQKNVVRDCDACGEENSFGPARPWMIPTGFAHPVDMQPDTTPDAPFSQSHATRAKLAVNVRRGEGAKEVYFNKRVRGWIDRSELLVTNRGPSDMGYDYCVACGRIERSVHGSGLLDGTHNKPFPAKLEEKSCPGAIARGVVLGTRFISDILLLSLQLDPSRGIRLPAGSLGTDIALRTVCEALAQAAAQELQIEKGEVEAEYRPALTQQGKTGAEVEIYLYDTVAGGAGFSRMAGHHGMKLLEVARELLVGCPNKKCDASCYRCLRRFTNRFEHDRLDRFTGTALLDFLIDGTPPRVTTARLQQAVDTLNSGLKRVGHQLRIERNVNIEVAGVGPVEVPLRVTTDSGATTHVAIASPVAPDVPASPGLAEARDLGQLQGLLLDETLIRRNPARAVERILQQLQIA